MYYDKTINRKQGHYIPVGKDEQSMITMGHATIGDTKIVIMKLAVVYNRVVS